MDIDLLHPDAKEEKARDFPRGGELVGGVQRNRFSQTMWVDHEAESNRFCVQAVSAHSPFVYLCVFFTFG